MAETVVVEERVYLYKRTDSKKWWMRYRLEAGNWARETTKEENFEAAKEVAFEAYRDVQYLKKKGVKFQVKGKKVIKFTDVLDAYIQKLKEDNAAGVGKAIYKTYIGVAENWLEPFFRGKALHEVDEDLIDHFEDSRRKKLGREPAKSTINSHNCVLRAIFQHARRKKYILVQDIPVFTAKNKGVKAENRARFMDQEIENLRRFMLKWYREDGQFITKYKRELLYYYVQFLLASGVRPGEETAHIKWKHVDVNWLNTYDKKNYVRIEMPNRKTNKSGYILLPLESQGFLSQLKALTKQGDDEDLIFCMPDGKAPIGFSQMFATCLEEADLRYNKIDQGRSLYSLRYYYATNRILKEKVDWVVLADQMGTSVSMLERFYVELKKEMEAGQLALSHNILDLNKITQDINTVDLSDVDEGTKAKILELLKASK